ncbi:MAG: isochorismatase family protein [Fimbriimonas sp.]|nr:isochorismatase family protein [Fimbriimonas sp.]
MPCVKLDPGQSALLIIDIQPVLNKTIFEADRVLSRSAFLIKMANLLDIPVLATEQNPFRMGQLEPSLSLLVRSELIFSKMAFSAAGSSEFLDALALTGRKQVVLVGIETHICVSQTAHDLQRLGYQVVVCPDGVSARSLERHKLGMERIRDAGIVPAHTESVAYEWLGSAAHPEFKSALSIVKENP